MHTVRPVIIKSAVSTFHQGPDGIQSCIPVTISIDAATSSYRCKIKQDIPRARSQYANVFYPRYSRVLRQKLHGQTSASPAPRELSLMLRQKKKKSPDTRNFIRPSEACLHFTEEKHHYFLFQGLCCPRKRAYLKWQT